MLDRGIAVEGVEDKIRSLEQEGKTAMIAAVDGHAAGIIAVADTLKEHTVEAVKEIQKMGLEVVMLTGDNRRTAATIAKKIATRRVLVLPDPADRDRSVIKGQT